MKYAVITLLVLCVVAIAAFFLLRARHDSEADPGGFVDWVKNPDYKRSAAEYFAARDALTVPDDISPAEIQHMVEQLFVEEDNDFNFDRLKLVGEKAVPFLISTLSDNRTRTAIFIDDDSPFGRIIDRSPFERICDLLEPFGPPKAVPAILPYATHADEYFRKTAAITLGNIGSIECVEPITMLLNDDDDYVRSYAMMGIERGIAADRATKQFLDGVFPSLVKLLDRDDESGSGTAPELLLAIDRERAIPMMLSAEIFSTSNKKLHYILQAFNEIEYKIPHEKLLPLLAKPEPLIGKYPHDYGFAAALIAYSHHPDANAKSFLRTSMKSPNKKVSEGAAEALGILSGVTDPSDHVFTLFDENGWENLSQPQQNYYAVLAYDGEVNNGGHSQYFVNSSGDLYKTASNGLTAIGANQRAQILSDAVALFGDAGPSTDNDRRHQQLASFTSAQDSKLDALNSKYYKCDENIDVLLSTYALKNKEHFTRGK